MAKRMASLSLCLLIISSMILGAGNIAVLGAEAPLGDLADWVSVYPDNNQNDFLMDQQTGSGSVSQDIVGDATHPSTYMRVSTEALSIRIRLSNVDGASPYQFKNFAFVGIDADIDGSIDFFLGVYNPTGNNGRIGIYSAAAGYANISPSSTGISGKPLMAYQPLAGMNYELTPASSNLNGTPNYFISFKIPLADITSALASCGFTFTASTPFRFITGTAAQDNSFNQDINGMDSTGWSSGKTWNNLGVFSSVVSIDGTANVCAVTFDNNTGDTEASPAIMAVEAGQPLGGLPALSPTKRGMYFQEWNTQPDGSGNKITAAAVVDQDMTVYAIWSNVAVSTVTFYPNGGNFSGSTATITVPTINGAVGNNMPPNPTMTNRYFTGWLIENTTNYLNSTTEVVTNTNVYAQWANTANKVAVFYDNFDTSGGSEIARIYSNGNSNNFNGTLPVIERPGYTFGGWFLNDINCLGTAVTDISSQGNYYARWVSANYIVTYDMNYSGAPAGGSKSVSDGRFGDMPAEPVLAGNQFIEWNRTPDASGEAMYPSSIISSDTTVYAIWKPIQAVTFDANNGLFDSGDAQWSTTAIDGVLALLPQPPSRDNNTFLGWSSTMGGSDPASLLDVTGRSTYYAIWSPVYIVTFNENNGATPATTDVLTAYGSVLYLPAAPELSDYRFIGWDTASDGSGTDFMLASAVSDDMTVYAQWEPTSVQYTVNFVANGGTAVDSQVTGEITTAPVTTRSGYSFDGWYSDEILEHPVSFPLTVTGLTTLHAAWTPADVAVTFSANLGEFSVGVATTEIQETFGNPYSLPSTDPTRAGYQFTGWNTQADGLGATIAGATEVSEAEPHTIYAVWTELGHVSISYASKNADYGSVTLAFESLNPFSSDAQGSTAEPAPGYRFLRWINGEGQTVSTEANFMPARADDGLYHDNEYIAVFAEISCDVTVAVHLDDAAYHGQTLRLTSDGGQTFIDLAEQPDHKYAGQAPNGDYVIWNGGRSTGCILSVAGQPAAGELNYYTLKVCIGSGILVVGAGGIYLAGAAVPALTATVQAGSSWLKWQSSNTAILPDQTALNVSFTMPAGTLTLTATAQKTKHAINVTTSNHGSSKVNGQCVEFYPDPGYVIQDVLIDGVSVGPLSRYTLPDDNSDHDIVVLFMVAEAIPQTGENAPTAGIVLLVAAGLLLLVLRRYRYGEPIEK